MKRFNVWNCLKQRIDALDHGYPRIYEKQVWWVSLGENIGTELYGKGDTFSRPVIVFKKLSHTTFLTIPTSSKHKNGSWFYPFALQGRSVVACLHQVRVLDSKRFLERQGEMNDKNFTLLKKAFADLYVS
jgi:mRNA interferase MazF